MKVLLVQTGFIGDVILSTPVIRAVRRLYPDAALTLLTTPAGAQLFRTDPDIAEVIAFDKRGKDSGFTGMLRLSRALRSRKFTVAVSLHKSYRTAMLLLLSGIPIRAGFSEASFSAAYTVRASRTGGSHEVLRNLAIVRAFGCEPEDFEAPLSLTLSEAEHGRAEELLADAKGTLIGIAPGSVWATKRWTIEGFAELAQALQTRGMTPVLIGGKEDAELGARIAAEAAGPLINLIGKTSLGESAAVVARLAVLVTNDSSPLHLASACRTPAVAIFCATVPEFGYGPWKIPSCILEVSGLSCRPCGRHGGMTCPTGTHACQLGITAPQVLAAIDGLLQGEALYTLPQGRLSEAQ